jgi:hypothetical protein
MPLTCGMAVRLNNFSYHAIWCSCEKSKTLRKKNIKLKYKKLKKHPIKSTLLGSVQTWISNILRIELYNFMYYIIIVYIAGFRFRTRLLAVGLLIELDLQRKSSTFLTSTSKLGLPVVDFIGTNLLAIFSMPSIT